MALSAKHRLLELTKQHSEGPNIRKLREKDEPAVIEALPEKPEHFLVNILTYNQIMTSHAALRRPSKWCNSGGVSPGYAGANGSPPSQFFCGNAWGGL